MYCTKCGREIKDSNSICPHCGSVQTVVPSAKGIGQLLKRCILGFIIWLISVILFALIGSALKLHEATGILSRLYSVTIAVLPIVLAVTLTRCIGKKSSASQQKTPFYKKWWVWVLLVIVLIVGGKSDEEATPIETVEPTIAVTVPDTTAATTLETTILETTIPETEPETVPASIEHTYILNTNSMKFHYSSCSGAAKIKDSNKGTFTGTREEIIAKGYESCGICTP